MQPDLLLLDEPTNHLDAEIGELAGRPSAQYPGAILIVTHDRYFLDNVTGWILELDRGKGIPYEGNYTSWLCRSKAPGAGRPRGRRASSARWQREANGSRQSPKARQAKSKARYRAL
jgi:ATPase subunit of ABC transporter with duplicated ATPase domains